jgi:hypothetical protein
MARVGAEAFLYLNPEDISEFAQCSTCSMWVREENSCTIHGQYIEVPGSASCGFYIIGDPQEPGTPTEAIVTPVESGLVDREVRCENCRWGGPGNYTCLFFEQLNAQLPEIFEIDTDIDPGGCCNAQQPRET